MRGCLGFNHSVDRAAAVGVTGQGVVAVPAGLHAVCRLCVGHAL